MCHHYQAARKLPAWLVNEFAIRSNLRLLTDLQSGVYPLSTVPVIRADGDRHELVGMEWGLLPRWWKPSGKSSSRKSFQRKTFNARCETVHEKPTFSNAFKHRRCLMPVAQFFEKGHYFGLPDNETFCFASLWESWDGGDDGEVLSCTLLTTVSGIRKVQRVAGLSGAVKVQRAGASRFLICEAGKVWKRAVGPLPELPSDRLSGSEAYRKCCKTWSCGPSCAVECCQAS